MTALDEPRLTPSSTTARRTRRQAEPMDELSFDDLMADTDSDTGAIEPRPARTHANALEPAGSSYAAAARATAPGSTAPRATPSNASVPTSRAARKAPAKGEHPKGQFYRPELYTTTQRVTGNVMVRVSAVVLLLGGTAALVYLALDRFS
jgi:uncharacterized membrane protein